MLAEAVGSRSAGLRGRADRSLLTVTDVHHAYAGIEAMADVDLEVDEREAVCIIGRTAPGTRRSRR